MMSMVSNESGKDLKSCIETLEGGGKNTTVRRQISRKVDILPLPIFLRALVDT